MLVDDPTKFIDKYSVNSPRLKNWDYSTPGIYFITICTVHHNKFFGKIIDGQMELSDKGIIVKNCLLAIPMHFPSVQLNSHVIMPNHIHLLLTIKSNLPSVETHHDASLQNKYHNYYFHQLANKSIQTIPLVIKQFKSSVARLINPKTTFFAWQPRFHDEIIKDDKRFLVLKQYLKNNPKKWEKDEYNR